MRKVLLSLCGTGTFRAAVVQCSHERGRHEYEGLLTRFLIFDAGTPTEVRAAALGFIQSASGRERYMRYMEVEGHMWTEIQLDAAKSLVLEVDGEGQGRLGEESSHAKLDAVPGKKMREVVDMCRRFELDKR